MIANALSLDGIRARYVALDRAQALRAAVGKTATAVSVVGMTPGECAAALDIIEALHDAGSPIIMLVGSGVEQVTIATGITAGAAGYVLTTATLQRLRAAIVAAGEGREVLTLKERYELEDALRRHDSELRANVRRFEALTRRESEVLEGLVAGKRAEQMADEAFVAVSTVRSQIKSVLCKLGVHSQLEAVALAHDARWPAAASG